MRMMGLWKRTMMAVLVVARRARCNRMWLERRDHGEHHGGGGHHHE